jgi:hypothetical protein
MRCARATAGLLRVVLGPDNEVYFQDPGNDVGLRVAADGALYVADLNNRRIRAITRVETTFQVAPAAVAFTAPAEGSPTAPRQVRLTSPLAGLPFAVRVKDGDWLRLSQRAGAFTAAATTFAGGDDWLAVSSGAQAVEVRVNHAGLAAAVPVVLSSAGQSCPPVTMAVR